MLSTLGSLAWLVPVWSGLLLLLLALGLLVKHHRYAAVVCAVLALIALIPLLPVTKKRLSNRPPEQVIYRFDDHRYLLLIGRRCEGALWYMDPKKGITADLDTRFFRISFYRYIHPSVNYIAIPDQAISEIMVSKNGGKSFTSSRFSPGGGGPETKGMNRPHVDDIASFTVVGDRGYFLNKNNDLFLSSAPFGSRWGLDYVSLASLLEHRQTISGEDDFQNPPHQVLEVKGYTGWDHMQCDLDAPSPMEPNPHYEWQQTIYVVFAYTIAAPIYLGLK
ncbi:T6SS immunity protein Tli3 family protein [Thorsellia anophelis]|uniref:Tli3-like domain-containing protein n=1 Tax=Thorsellia anophelis DSM 18579 TaxID=1123402 RepID=A0A1I0FGY9_9GAMM|nr:hypothetical protein [Thorsellia anophelis]SET57555.1 hypothetical protein SAMN02583745_02772 [Thorsellia anophelis DSM 18579]